MQLSATVAVPIAAPPPKRKMTVLPIIQSPQSDDEESKFGMVFERLPQTYPYSDAVRFLDDFSVFLFFVQFQYQSRQQKTTHETFHIPVYHFVLECTRMNLLVSSPVATINDMLVSKVYYIFHLNLRCIINSKIHLPVCWFILPRVNQTLPH